ncbi:MAG: hypothetical protein LUQ65_05800 [Candidatus Helarchaeota archaeon]|nr:hypothetical protein [Candidatus Helarchaeota archaeon]
MSYQEKRTLTSILSGVLVLAAYCIYAFNPSKLGSLAPDDLKFWATTMLIFIGIGIGATIIIQIVFHILISISIAVKEKIQDSQCDDKDIEKSIKMEMVEDERDKLIELKSMRVGFIIAGFGFVGALLSLLLNYSPVVMLNIIYISFNVGSLFEGAAQLYYYRRGV